MLFACNQILPSKIWNADHGIGKHIYIVRSGLYYDPFDWVPFGNASMVIGLNETMGKECCAETSSRLWGGRQ